MPIHPPRLDDRTFADLVAELLARIPGHTPEYTNPVPGDPGHTLVELFAWLADTLLYRVNLIPERQRLEFLRMVGVPLRGARPATGLVALSFKDLESGGPAVVERLRPWCTVGGAATFETSQVVTVLPVTGHVCHKRRLTAEERAAVEPLLSDLGELYELGKDGAEPYVTTPTWPGGLGRPAGFDLRSETVDGMVWIALLAGRARDVAAVREALGGGGTAPSVHVGVVPSEAWSDTDDLTLGLGTARPHDVAWELTTGRMRSAGQPELVALDVVADGTRGLTRAGVVELRLPPLAQIGRPPNGVDDTLDAGVGPRPPRLDDAELEARVVTWLRLRPNKSVDRLSLAWVGLNVAPIDQRRTLHDVGLGVSTGAPDQRFPLPSGGVEASSFQLEVEEEGVGFRAWEQVPFLGLGGRDSRVYELDGDEGSIRFGDGVRGRIPARGRQIRVRRMRAGGGPEGNLPPGRLTSIVPARAADGASVDRPFLVVQPVPTAGGTPAESLAEAERRIPDVLRHRERAVTAPDLVAVAAGTPGVRLGRVEVIKGFKPHQRREGVPGVVSVMVLPRVDGWMPPAPRPSRHTLEAVHEWVSARVPLATELYAIGCEYRPIGLGVAYELRAGFEQDATTQAVKTALRTMLWPLPPGGPFEEAGGWPRGRPVREREIEVAVARVPGVDEVIGVSLFVLREDGAWRRVARGSDGSAQIALTEWQLPEVLRLEVSVEGVPEDLDGPVEPGGGVAVPVVPDLC